MRFSNVSYAVLLSAFILPGVANAQAGAAAKIIGAAASGGEKIIDSVGVATGGVVSGGKMEIDTKVKVDDVNVKAGKDADMNVSLGGVSGLKSKGDMKVKTDANAGKIDVQGGDNSSVRLNLGGVGR